MCVRSEGKARALLAEKSRDRPVTEAAELAEEKAELQQRLRAAAPRTDHGIDDDAAGKARTLLAEQSRQRQAEAGVELAEQNEELAEQNEEQAARLARMGASVDTGFDDEAAGAQRKELALKAKARRKQEAAELRARNAEMRARLGAVRTRADDGDGSSGGVASNSLIAAANLTPLERESSLSVSKYLMWQVSNENLVKGDGGRDERRVHRDEKERRAAATAAAGAVRVAERRERDERTRRLREQIVQERQRQGEMLREEEARWQAERDEALAEMHMATAARVVSGG